MTKTEAFINYVKTCSPDTVSHIMDAAGIEESDLIYKPDTNPFGWLPTRIVVDIGGAKYYYNGDARNGWTDYYLSNMGDDLLTTCKDKATVIYPVDKFGYTVPHYNKLIHTLKGMFSDITLFKVNVYNEDIIC